MKIRFLIIIIMLSSCSAPKFALKHTGDIAVVNLKSKSTFSGEFLFVKDNHIYLLLDESQSSNPSTVKKYSVSSTQINQIESMTINGYSDRSWGTSILIFQVVPAFVLALVGASVDGDNFAPVLGVGLVPVLLSWLLFEGSTPSSPSFENFIEQDNIEELKKYSRFPQGLTNNQLEELLKMHNQVEIKEIN